MTSLTTKAASAKSTCCLSFSRTKARRRHVQPTLKILWSTSYTILPPRWRWTLTRLWLSNSNSCRREMIPQSSSGWRTQMTLRWFHRRRRRRRSTSRNTRSTRSGTQFGSSVSWKSLGQSKCLRYLQQRKFSRIGCHRAANSQDLKQAAQQITDLTLRRKIKSVGRLINLKWRRHNLCSTITS